jgi:hypothetical protein
MKPPNRNLHDMEEEGRRRIVMRTRVLEGRARGDAVVGLKWVNRRLSSRENKKKMMMMKMMNTSGRCVQCTK